MTSGALDCTRLIALSDPRTGHALAIVDEHLVYQVRSTAAAAIPLKWVGPVAAKVLGLVGIGSMGTNMMRCLLTMYDFQEIRVTSRRRETREAFAAEWGAKLGIAVRAMDSVEEVVSGATVGHHDSARPTCRRLHLAGPAQFETAGWAKMDRCHHSPE
jgi:ornithine cyclodeaminase